MFTPFDLIFDKFFNQMQTLPDDGSINAYQNTCQTLPTSTPTTLLLIEYQASSPIASNPGGSGGGK